MNTNVWKVICNDKLAFIGLILFIIIITLVNIGALAINHPIAARIHINNWDVLRLVILSARNSLTIALIISIAGTVIGTFFGLIAGFSGRFVDYISTRIINFFSIMPSIMLIIVLVSIIPNYSTFIFVLLMVILIAWQITAKQIMIKTQQKKALDYIAASKTLGTPNIIIMFKEILPHLSLTIASCFTVNFTIILGLETGLTFLGFGLPLTTPSLGQLLSYKFLPAALFIIILTLCISLVSLALSQADNTTSLSS